MLDGGGQPGQQRRGDARLVNPAESGAPRRCRARLPASTLEKMAPKIATPDDPPVEPKNVAPQGGDAEF